MFTKWTLWLSRMRGSFWFLPTLMAIGSVGLALMMVWLDRYLDAEAVSEFWWAFDGGASGARDVMSTIAGSMITVAGVVFSITIVTLSLTSQQFGPRLLRNFLRDLPTQCVFGCFVGTFLYCLLVLRSIRAEHESIVAFVPNLGVAVGVLFAAISIFVLVFFIHHTANSIRAPTLAWRTSQQLLEALARLYPAEENRIDHTPISAELGDVTKEVRASSSGYIQGVDRDGFQAIEKRCGLGLEVIAIPGTFVAIGDIVARARGGEIDERGIKDASTAFTTGHERTLDQDPQFGFAMLTEMAVRSVSPSMNDPYTAMQCIDRIREGLTFLSKRRYPSQALWRLPTFEDILDGTWRDLIYYARENPPVMAHLSESLLKLKDIVARNEDKVVIERWLKTQPVIQ